jgi:hypothetical protein
MGPAIGPASPKATRQQIILLEVMAAAIQTGKGCILVQLSNYSSELIRYGLVLISVRGENNRTIPL